MRKTAHDGEHAANGMKVPRSETRLKSQIKTRLSFLVNDQDNSRQHFSRVTAASAASRKRRKFGSERLVQGKKLVFAQSH